MSVCAKFFQLRRLIRENRRVWLFSLILNTYFLRFKRSLLPGTYNTRADYKVSPWHVEQMQLSFFLQYVHHTSGVKLRAQTQRRGCYTFWPRAFPHPKFLPKSTASSL